MEAETTTRPHSKDDLSEKHSLQQDREQVSKSNSTLKDQQTSTSLKSGYGSKPRLKRTLKRKIDARFFEVEDARWLFAAYKLGAFEDIQRGLDKDGFLETIATLIQSVNGLWVIETDKPIGVIVGKFGTESHHLWVEVEWFPWASKRDRLTGALRFLVNSRDAFLVLISLREKDKKFAEHLSKYGVFTRIAKVPGWFSDESGMLFRSK